MEDTLIILHQLPAEKVPVVTFWTVKASTSCSCLYSYPTTSYPDIIHTYGLPMSLVLMFTVRHDGYESTQTGSDCLQTTAPKQFTTTPLPFMD